MKKLIILLLFIPLLSFGQEIKVEVNSNGLFINSNKITNETDASYIESVLGKPDKKLLEKNTVWMYDELGIKVSFDQETEKNIQIGIQLNVDDARGPKTKKPFSGNLIIHGFYISENSPWNSISKIPEIQIDYSVPPILYFTYDNNLNHSFNYNGDPSKLYLVNFWKFNDTSALVEQENAELKADNRINYYATELESGKEQIFQDKSSRDFAVDILGTHIRPRDEIVSASQSYLAYVNQVVNFRKGPGTEFDIIKALQVGTQIFVISTIDKNGYYNVIDLETNTEGYVYKSYVVLDRVIEINEDDLFVESGKSSSSTVSEVEVYNNTDKVLTVFIGGNSYFFSAQEKRKINIKPGEYDYRVTAPGVLPYLGKDKIVSGFNYSWQFYIITK